MPFSSERRSRWLSVLILAAISLIAVVRVALTYRQTSATFDETDHIACGMQWLDRGEYLYEPMHPVVARVSTALLPYLDGARAHADTNLWAEGNKILNGQHTYWRTLALARLGMLPFLLLGICLTYFWSRKLFDRQTAWIASAVLSLLPLVLAHAGLATTDIPATALFLAMCFTFEWWMDLPSVRRSLVLGVVLAVGICTKFSTLFFFPPVAIALVVFRSWLEWTAESRSSWKRIKDYLNLRDLAVVMGTVAIMIWTLYRFSVGPVVLPYQVASYDAHLRAAWPHGGWKYSLFYSLGHTSIPAPSFFNGIGEMFILNHVGIASYFMGHMQGHSGSVLFYPVAFLVKSPLAFVVLAAIGLYALLRSGRSPKLLPIVVIAPIAAICLVSRFNIGARHLLPLMPFLSMVAAVGVGWLWRKQAIGKAVAASIAVWLVVESASAHPAYLSYFNEAFAAHREHYLLDSDLDWGQDADKMADSLRARHITHVLVAYQGTLDLRQRNFPPFDTLRRFDTVRDQWIAISKFKLYADSGYRWLQTQQPIANVGASMVLYGGKP